MRFPRFPYLHDEDGVGRIIGDADLVEVAAKVAQQIVAPGQYGNEFIPVAGNCAESARVDERHAGKLAKGDFHRLTRVR